MIQRSFTIQKPEHHSLNHVLVHIDLVTYIPPWSKELFRTHWVVMWCEKNEKDSFKTCDTQNQTLDWCKKVLTDDVLINISVPVNQHCLSVLVICPTFRLLWVCTDLCDDLWVLRPVGIDDDANAARHQDHDQWYDNFNIRDSVLQVGETLTVEVEQERHHTKSQQRWARGHHDAEGKR